MSLSAITGATPSPTPPSPGIPIVELARKLCSLQPVSTSENCLPPKTPRTLTKGALDEVQELLEERNRKIQATEALLKDHALRAEAAEAAANACWDQASYKEISQTARIHRVMVKCLRREIEGIEAAYESNIQKLESSHEQELHDAMARRVHKQQVMPDDHQSTTSGSETSDDHMMQGKEQLIVSSEDQSSEDLSVDRVSQCDTTECSDVEEFAIMMMLSARCTQDAVDDHVEVQSNGASSSSSSSSTQEITSLNFAGHNSLPRTDTLKHFTSKDQQTTDANETCNSINGVARGLLFQQECRDVDAEFTTLSSDFQSTSKRNGSKPAVMVAPPACLSSPTSYPRACLSSPTSSPPQPVPAKPFQPCPYPPTPRKPPCLASMSKTRPRAHFSKDTPSSPNVTSRAQATMPLEVEKSKQVGQIENLWRQDARRLVNIEVEVVDPTDAKHALSASMPALSTTTAAATTTQKEMLDTEVHERKPVSVTFNPPLRVVGYNSAEVDESEESSTAKMKEISIAEPKEVFLHVYQMSQSSGGIFTGFLSTLGMGMYHVGVQVCGQEWTFNPRGPIGCKYACGIVMQDPGKHPAYSLHDTISLGCTQLHKEEIEALITQYQKEWSIDSHHELRRNSVTFAEEFCEALGVRAPPSYVSALTRGLRTLMFT